MARIFITGSADGLGLLSAQSLINEGHEVVLHARSSARAEEALIKVKGTPTFLIGDLSKMEETVALAEQVNALGTFDAFDLQCRRLSGIGQRHFRCQYIGTLHSHLSDPKT